MSTTKPLTWKNYLWIVGVPVAVIALIPLFAAFGMVLQFGLLAIMPLVLVATTAHAFLGRAELTMMQVQGIDVPETLRLHPRHSWARRASSRCVMTGIDDFAQCLVGSVESVETRRIGQEVVAGDVMAILRHGEHEIPVRAPIEGTIARVNPALGGDPAVVNRSPYGSGWLVELTAKPSTLNASLKSLLRGRSAMRWMRGEVDRLVALTGSREVGPTLADGGEVDRDLSLRLDEATWGRVKAEFFS